MSKTAKILEMKALGFTNEQIAKHTGLGQAEVGELIRETQPPKKPAKTSRPPAAKSRQIKPALLPSPPEPAINLTEIKPGFYLITADDLLGFFQRLQERETEPVPVDPYEDYIQREDFQQKFGVSDTSMHRYQKEGILEVYKLGNKCFLKKSQVVKALESGKL